MPKTFELTEQQQFDRYIASCNLHYAIIKQNNGEELSEEEEIKLKALEKNIKDFEDF